MLSKSPKNGTTHTHTLPPAETAVPRRLSANTLRAALFWGSFLLLNLLIFLPAFLLNSAHTSLLPPLSAALPDAARQLLAWRSNLDPFRLSAEFTLLVSGWVFLASLRSSRWRRPYRVLTALTLLLAIVYAIYENLSIFFYRDDPVFYAQARLVAEGLPFVARHLSLSPLLPAALLLAILLAIAALMLLLSLLIRPAQAAALGLGSRAVLIALSMLVLASFLFNGRALAGPKSVVSCLTCKLGSNISASLAAARQVQAIDRLAPQDVYDYSGQQLLVQPDIYLIFVESYGSVLYGSSQLRAPYLALLDDLEQQLDNQGWGAATILSESPSWGGGSWMAYTSALFGLRVDTHPVYLSLLERFSAGGYPHLGDTLTRMGYEQARVTALSVELDDEQWQQYKGFFGVDRWLRYSDLAYDGQHYGWGPAPPDQYVLHYANEQFQRSPKPQFFFMITQNSHYPWQEIPPLVDDWRALADGSDANPQANLTTPKVTVDPVQYAASIAYELRMLTRFILQEADEQAVVILIGDHQPGYITRKADGYATPLHIISKDAALLASLDAYGFAGGLSVAELQPGMKHEGFYSLLMRALLDRYGRGDRLPPPYLPDGIPDAALVTPP